MEPHALTSELDDPRTSNAPRHKFCDLMTKAFCAPYVGVKPSGQNIIFCASFWSFLWVYPVTTHFHACFS